MDAKDLEPGRNRAMAALFDRLLALCVPIIGAVLYHVFDFHLYHCALTRLREGRTNFEVNNGCLILPLAYASLAGFVLGLLALLFFALANLA